MNRFACPLYFWFAAVLCAFMPLAAYEAESFLLSFILLCMALIVGVSFLSFSGGLRISKSPLIAVGLGFWCLAFISVLLSDVWFVSFIYFCFFSALPLSFLIFFTVKEHQKALFFALCILMASLSVISLVSYFTMPSMLVEGRTHWPLANSNSLGGFLSLGFFGALGWMLAAHKRAYSNMALALVLLILAAIFTTGSRGAVVALGGSFLLMMILSGFFAKKHWRCLCFVALGGVLSFILISALKPVGARAPSTLLFETAQGVTSVLHSRPEIWASTWAIIQDHFWTGTGIGTFFLYYPEYRGDDFITAGLMVHNDPLQFWAEMGVFAPVLFYLFIVLACVRMWRTLRLMGDQDVRRLYVLVPFCAFAALVAHTHISFHFYVLPILMLGGGVLGFWFYQTEEILKGQTYEIPANPLLLKTAMVIPLVAIIYVFSLWQGSEILLNRAQRAGLDSNIESFADNVNRAGKLSGNKNARALVMASSVSLGILQVNGPLMPLEARQDLYKDGMALLERAQRYNPRLSGIDYNKAALSEALAAEGGFVENYTPPEIFLTRALALDPLHLPTRRKLAALYDAHGEEGKAYETLKAGLKWPYKDQDRELYYQELARRALERGDMDTHLVAMDKIRFLARQRKKYGRN